MKKILFLVSFWGVVLSVQGQVRAYDIMLNNQILYSARSSMFTHIYLDAVIKKGYDRYRPYFIEDSLTLSNEEIDKIFCDRQFKKLLEKTYIYSFDLKSGVFYFYNDQFYGNGRLKNNYLMLVKRESDWVYDIGNHEKLNLHLKVADCCDSINNKNEGFVRAKENEMDKKVAEAHRKDSIESSKRNNLRKIIEDSRKKAQEEKLNKCILKYGKKVGTQIANGEIWIGMTSAMLRDSMGEPDRLNITSARYGHQQWVYGNTFVYLEGDKVTDFQVF